MIHGFERVKKRFGANASARLKSGRALLQETSVMPRHRDQDTNSGGNSFSLTRRRLLENAFAGMVGMLAASRSVVVFARGAQQDDRERCFLLRRRYL